VASTSCDFAGWACHLCAGFQGHDESLDIDDFNYLAGRSLPPYLPP
jgi:hypothetical protein